MNKHLNAFSGYHGPDTHEDQLTRAAMIVMRAVPLARAALLDRLDCTPVARLSGCAFDMQTRYVVEPNLDPDGEIEQGIDQLVSVFLSPDEKLDLSDRQIWERQETEQRIDGVLRFGHSLVVTIESKIVGGQSSHQAEALRLRDVSVGESRVEHLGWHVLLEDWWNLLDGELLGPAERTLVGDLIDFAEANFPHLLPFTTLKRAGDDDHRQQRRLMAILREATGQPEGVRPRENSGAELMLEKHLSTQRIALLPFDGDLTLCTWPAELQAQAKAFYGSDRAERLLALAGSDAQWSITPNFHLAFWLSRAPLYTQVQIAAETYVMQWSGPDLSRLHSYPPSEIETDVWPWLIERGYATEEDKQWLPSYLEKLGTKDAHLRPGLDVRRHWPWAKAVGLDEVGRLVPEVRAAILDLLTALREPVPASFPEP